MGNYELSPTSAAAVGITSNGEGTRQWVVDENGHVYVYGPTGAFYGSWQATNVTTPTDITTDGTHIWIVDDAFDRVYRYANAASIIAGYLAPTDSFVLSSGNVHPTGLVTDGELFWVTDHIENGSNSVFVYDDGGDALGDWQLDAENTSPVGIALSLSGASTNLWVVDDDQQEVFVYVGGTAWRDGTHNSDDQWSLTQNNTSPVGIADPNPFFVDGIRLNTPTSIRADAGTPIMISGTASAGGKPAHAVTVNGKNVDVIDDGGNFFARDRLRRRTNVEDRGALH